MTLTEKLTALKEKLEADAKQLEHAIPKTNNLDEQARKCVRYRCTLEFIAMVKDILED